MRKRAVADRAKGARQLDGGEEFTVGKRLGIDLGDEMRKRDHAAKGNIADIFNGFDATAVLCSFVFVGCHKVVQFFF